MGMVVSPKCMYVKSFIFYKSDLFHISYNSNCYMDNILKFMGRILLLLLIKIKKNYLINLQNISIY